MKRGLLTLLTLLLVLSMGINVYAQEDVEDTEPVAIEDIEGIQEDIEEDHDQDEKVIDGEIIDEEEIEVEEETVNIPVLLYHHIIPEEDLIPYNWLNNQSVISEENFSDQMTYLHENGYYTASLDELEGFIKGELILPKNTVVITFDDGYLSNARFAYPIMKEYGFKGAIFMVGRTSIMPQRVYSPMGTQHINRYYFSRYEDVFQFEDHTFNMHYLIGGKAAVVSLSQDQIYSDLILNKYLLKTDYIAYPYGQYNPKILNSVEKLGYKLGFSTMPRYVSVGEPIYKVPRFSIYQSTSMEQFMKIVNGE